MSLPPAVETRAMIHGYAFGSAGQATRLDWDAVKSAPIRDGRRSWIHLNRLHPEVQRWLRTTSGLEPIEADVMLEEDTRPRSLRHGDAILLNLRGVNTNEGARPEDMIALRIFVHKDTVLTMRAYPVLAVSDLLAEIEAGRPPTSSGELVTFLAQRLTDRIDSVITTLDEEAAGYEDILLGGETTLPKTVLANFRRKVLHLRRYIVPQREALAHLVRDNDDLFSQNDLLALRETSNQITRLAEDLDTVRERSTVLQEQIVEQRAEAMNERLFVLAIISAIFLPLGFFTGLFGVNVGGMPGVNSAIAFTLLCLSMLGILGVLLLIFKRMRWL